ncbi:universal stress protein [Pseudonocardia sp. Cha107L01]|jgi:nucleotide-binding universal stress UspA family protein|uniref:universal stress protein n=1 Tax=Pseudonocardia sp. Cha107L01 TaxID=3457576 RepID=UPI00403EAD88
MARTHDHSTNPTIPTDAVLVGVDGSAHALAAVRWAAAEAASRGAPLALVHAAPYLDVRARPTPQVRHATGVLARARTEAERYIDRAAVRTDLETGEPARTLSDLSARAALLVLGLTGTGGIDEILLGSTTTTLSGHVRCPLVGVRRWPLPAERDRFVLLGLDSVEAEADAIEVAFDLARRRARELLVLHARFGAPGTHDLPNDRAVRRERNLLAWNLRVWRHRYPDVRVSYALPAGLASSELLKRSAHAEAIVVGSRKRHPAARVLLGSTSGTLLRYSPVPVIVIGLDAAVRWRPAAWIADPDNAQRSATPGAGPTRHRSLSAPQGSTETQNDQR